MQSTYSLREVRTPPRSQGSSITEEAMSLLSTPPVRKKTPVHQQVRLEPERTPQSILKTGTKSRISQLIAESKKMPVKSSPLVTGVK